MMIQLGFCVPVTEDSPPLGHTSPDWSQWDGGQVGGLLSWLEPRHIPARPLYCQCQNGDCPCSSEEEEEKRQSLPVREEIEEADVSLPSPQDSPSRRRRRLLHYWGQLYAPAPGDAPRFHRTLYLFGCTRCARPECHSRVRVLRTQLPQTNPYWPPATATVSKNRNLCAVCRFPAVGQCPRTRQFFCAREHQRRYVRAVPVEGAGSFPGIYTVAELVVEEEPPLPQVVELKDGDDEAITPLFPDDENNDDGDSDDDAQLEQEDLNAILAARPAPTLPRDEQKKRNQAVFTEFTRRITERPNCRDQVLRYNCAWPDGEDDEDNAPLWVRDDFRPATIPPCPLCGTARHFEFQLLPQFLSYLTPTAALSRGAMSMATDPAVLAALQQTETLLAHTAPVHIAPALVEEQQRLIAGRRRQLLQSNSQNEDRPLDWGVVAVYTCPNAACAALNAEHGPLGAYCEEFAWVQPPIDAHWEG